MSAGAARHLGVVATPVPGAPKVSLRGVRKSYSQTRGDHVVALEDVTFHVSPGEFVCLLGPSGSGKTTVLNLVAGLDRPDAGEVLMDGRPVPGPGPDRALLFQDPALFPWMSVLGNVEFALRLIGAPASERQERALTWLAKVHLGRFASAHPHELSAGMRQRVALSRALACRPAVLLADEPFGALDAQTREILQREVEDVWAETGTTLLFVTHNVREAALLADRVLLMSAPPGTLIEEYRIAAERPRRLEDPLLTRLVVEIHERLDAEVSKVVERETGERLDLA